MEMRRTQSGQNNFSGTDGRVQKQMKIYIGINRQLIFSKGTNTISGEKVFLTNIFKTTGYPN